MKRASLESGRDGEFVVVPRDLPRGALPADRFAPTLQAILDDRTNAAPGLAALAERIEREPTSGFPWDERAGASPLRTGAPATPFLKFGDVVRIGGLDEGGRSIFGAIERETRKYG